MSNTRIGLNKETADNIEKKAWGGGGGIAFDVRYPVMVDSGARFIVNKNGSIMALLPLVVLDKEGEATKVRDTVALTMPWVTPKEWLDAQFGDPNLQVDYAQRKIAEAEEKETKNYTAYAPTGEPMYSLGQIILTAQALLAGTEGALPVCSSEGPRGEKTFFIDGNEVPVEDYNKQKKLNRNAASNLFETAMEEASAGFDVTEHEKGSKITLPFDSLEGYQCFAQFSPTTYTNASGEEKEGFEIATGLKPADFHLFATAE